MVTTADTTRAYLVVVRHGGTSRERLAVAPLLDGGGLRIWIIDRT